MADLDDRMDVEAAAAGTEVDEELVSEAALLEALETSDPAAAMKAYAAIAAAAAAASAELSRKELAFARLAPLYAKHGRMPELRALVAAVQPFSQELSKAKGSKLFRAVVDAFLALDGHLAEKIALCDECIAWAGDQKRRFLRQALEIRVCGLHLELQQFQVVLTKVQPLVKELKKLDDKNQLVEVQLMESKAYFFLSNYPKSRGSLVSARTTATSIYCPPKMQAALDLQSGILHAQERDYKTAYSYFYEAFEGFDSVDQKNDARFGLKYMLLCKIMLSNASDVPTLLGGKLALKYSGRALDAMAAVGLACQHSALAEFETALADFKAELVGDVVVQTHVSELYDDLLQKNLALLVEPFSRVEIAHVADLIKLPMGLVETKLSQMILDKKLNGILDQGVGCLELFETQATDPTYTAALETVTHIGHVVETLTKKAQKLF